MSCIVSVSGSPYEQGLTQGKELKEVILRNLQRVDQKLKESRCDQKRYEAFVSRNLEMMRKLRRWKESPRVPACLLRILCG